MSGKINGISSGSPVRAVSSVNAGQPRNMPAAAAASSASAGNADSVEITGTASGLASAEQHLDQVPVINQARVRSVRDALEAGTYRIDSGKVADGLLDFESGLA